MSVEGRRGQWGREQACLCVCMCVFVCVCEREREREREFGVHVPHCTPHWRQLCRRGARPVWRNENKKSPRPQECKIDYERTQMALALARKCGMFAALQRMESAASIDKGRI